jgi:hypothetical protein
MTPSSRRKRRQKATELTLFLLDEKPDGWIFSELHKLVSDAMRARVSRTSLGLLMRPYFLNGTLEREYVSDNGVEVHIWRKRS